MNLNPFSRVDESTIEALREEERQIKSSVAGLQTENNHRSEVLRDQELKIADLDKRIAEREASLLMESGRLETARKDLSLEQDKINQSQTELLKMQSDLDHREEQFKIVLNAFELDKERMSEREKSVGDRENQLTLLAEGYNSKENSLVGRESTLANKGSSLSEREQQLTAESSRLNTLRDTLAGQQAEVANLRSVFERKLADNDTLLQSIEESKTEVVRKELELDKLRKELQAKMEEADKKLDNALEKEDRLEKALSTALDKQKALDETERALDSRELDIKVKETELQDEAKRLRIGA